MCVTNANWCNKLKPCFGIPPILHENMLYIFLAFHLSCVRANRYKSSGSCKEMIAGKSNTKFLVYAKN